MLPGVDLFPVLALVGIVALVVLCVLALVFVGVFLVVRPRSEIAAPNLPVGAPRREPTFSRPRSARALRGVEIDVPTRHADAIMLALQESGWAVKETGEVVATDEDEEGLTTLAVDVPSSGRPASGEEVH